MNLHSVKTRLVGGYFVLIVLFIAQVPIIYGLVSNTNKKYPQINEVASLRKRSVEISYILNRHILNGEEELEAVFQTKKKEFDTAVQNLKSGTADVSPLTEPELQEKLAAVSRKWQAMRATMDEAMTAGDALSEATIEVEKTTFPMVAALNEIVNGFESLKDGSYSKSINLAGMQRMRTAKMAYLVERYARSNNELNAVGEDIKSTIDDFEKTLIGLKNGSASLGLKATKNAALLEKFKTAEKLWAKRKTEILSIIKDKDTFVVKFTDLVNIRTPELSAASDDLSKAIAEAASKSSSNSVLVMIISIAVSAVCTLFFMWLTNNHLLKPLIRVKETVEAFSKGDLSRRSEVKLSLLGMEIKDEVTNLSDSVDSMASQMSGMISRIADSSSQLASAAEQLSMSSSQIAAGADKQSGQTVQVASAMEEMNATVIEVAKNSQQVSEAARNAQNIAVRGGEVVTQAISAMKDVSDSTLSTAETIRTLGRSSEEIGTIVSVINDIADQTNLLALNAAIEAARAGEQGRGFAVVADEVRKLAERTTKATKEISGMINTIQAETNKAVNAMSEGTKKVDNGMRLANEAGDALKRIVSGVESVTDMISHIATSAEEQSSTTDEITQNMDTIADVARANVTAITEVTRATSEMARLATELKGLTTSFRLTKSMKGAGIMDMRAVHEPYEKATQSKLGASGANPEEE